MFLSCEGLLYCAFCDRVPQDTALEPVRVLDRTKRDACHSVLRTRLKIASLQVPNPTDLFAAVRQQIYRHLADSSVFFQFFISNVGRV